MTPAFTIGDSLDPYAYPPRGLDLAAAARYLGIDPHAFRSLVESGKLPRPRRLGDATVWDRMALDTAFEATPAFEASTEEKSVPKPVRKRTSPTAMSEKFPGYHNVYTPETLAERWKCSAALVRNMIKRGELAGFKWGGKLLRISAEVVAAYETDHTVKARPR